MVSNKKTEIGDVVLVNLENKRIVTSVIEINVKHKSSNTLNYSAQNGYNYAVSNNDIIKNFGSIDINQFGELYPEWTI